MSDTLLKPGTETSLTFTDNAPADGARYASNAITLVADDVTAHTDQVLVTVEGTGDATSAGNAVNVYIAQGNTAGEYDGNVVPSVNPGAETLPNLDIPFPLIVANATLQQVCRSVSKRP